MRLNLRRVLRHPGMTVTMSYQDDIRLEREDVDVHVVGEAHARNDGRLITVWGTVQGVVTLPCSRCLQPVEYTIATTFEAECELRHFFAMADGNYEGLDEEVTLVFDESTANISELARQALILALPMRPLCNEQCKGICPLCGADLNKGTCSCQAPVDPRWAKLDELLAKLSH